MESNRHTPSVIARLMGLDELLPQQPAYKQSRILSENYLQKTASIGLWEKSSFPVGCSPSVNNKKREVITDAFAITPPKFKETVYSVTEENTISNISRVGTQIYADDKQNSVKKKSYNSGESDNQLEDLCSDEDNLPRYVQQENKLHDVWNFPSDFCVKHSAAFKSYSASKYGNNEICKKLDITSKGNNLRLLQELETSSVVGPIGEFETGQLDKLKFHFESKDNMYHPSTRIVVLRPSSVQYPKSDMDPPKQSFRFPFGTTRRRIQYARRYHVDNSKTKPVKLGTVIQPSVHPPGALNPLSSSSLNNNILDRTSYSFSNQLFFTKEAKRQMFEQWKMTKDFQEVAAAKGSHTLSSLGQMLTIDDLNAQVGYADCKKDKHGSCTSFSLHSYRSGCSNPLGISGKDGWKSEHSRTLPRSNSLHICSNVSGNPRIRTESSQYGLCLWQKEDVRNENKCAKQSQKHYVELGDGRVLIPEKRNASRFYKRNAGLLNSSSKSLAPTRNAAGLMANADTESIGISFMNFEVLHSEPSPSSLSSGDDRSSYSCEASVRQESLNESPQSRLVSLKDTTIDPNSTMKFKEANQNSPNSVLEPHFKEGKLPNSECFDSSVVDLHSVVMQLKLLETNSEETYSEVSEMAVSSVENTEKGSFYFSQELLGVFSTEESRDFSYLVDVLDEAHLNFEVDFDTCNSLESPINPLLFEALEKKYGKQISWLKSERRLLFDRINSWLSEILNSFTDIHIRAKSLKTRFHRTLRRSEVEEELWRLLVNEEKEVGKDLSEKALGMETKWLKMEREISILCKEVENYMFDELAAELYCI